MVARRRFLVAGTIVTVVTVGVFSVHGGEMLGALEDGRTTGSIGLASDFPSGARPSRPAEPSTSPRPARSGADTRPEDYGAVGGDSRDDSAAVQRAVDVAARRGSVARLSATTYVMDHALQIPSRGKLTGTGRKSVLKFTWIYNSNSKDGYYVGNRDQVDADTRDKRIRLRGFAIVGDGTGRPSGPNAIAPKPWVPALRMRLVDHLVIRGIHVRRSPGISMLLQGVTDTLVEHSSIDRSGSDGINIGWFERPSHHVLVKRNVVRRVGDDGLAVVGYPMEDVRRTKAVHRVRLSRNKILGWDENVNGLMLGRGIAVLGARRVKVTNNQVERTHSTGILVSGAGRPGLIDPATDKPWRSHRVLVRENDVRDAGLLSRGSKDFIPVGLLGGFVCKDSDHVEVRRNGVHAAVGHEFRDYGCTHLGPQGS